MLFRSYGFAFLFGMAGTTELAGIAEFARTAPESLRLPLILAFVLVAAGVLVLRVLEPDRLRPFRTPAAWLAAPAAILSCGYLPDRLRAGIGEPPPGMEVEVVVEDEPLGTAGAIETLHEHAAQTREEDPREEVAAKLALCRESDRPR